MKKISNSNLLKIVSFMKELNETYNVLAIPYYDDIEDDWNLAISDIDMFLSDDFQPMIQKVNSELEDGICLIQLSESLIEANDYLDYFFIFLEEFANSFEIKEQESNPNFALESYSEKIAPVVIFPYIRQHLHSLFMESGIPRKPIPTINLQAILS